MSDLQSRIEGLWEGRDSLSVDDPEVVATVHEAIDALDTGMARVAEWNPDGSVTVNQWCKYAVLLLFKISKMETIEHAPFEYADKIPLKSDYMERGVAWCPEPRPGGELSGPWRGDDAELHQHWRLRR